MTRTVFAYTDSEAFGGAEQALAILLTGLAGSGWRPTLLHSGAPGLDPLLKAVAPAGVTDRVVARMPEGLGGAARAGGLVRLLHAERPDVFHAHLTWPFACKWALAAAAVARVPAVLGTAQLYVDVPMGLSRRVQLNVLGRGVDRIIAVSEWTRESFAALGWPARSIVVIPNAVAVETFAGPADPEVRRSLEDGSGRPIALVPARLELQKGHRYLLEAARLLPGVRFACVGEGELRDGLAAEAVRLGVADRIDFLGFRRDMGALLRACDLVGGRRHRHRRHAGARARRGDGHPRPSRGSGGAGPGDRGRPRRPRADGAPGLGGAEEGLRPLQRGCNGRRRRPRVRPGARGRLITVG